MKEHVFLDLAMANAPIMEELKDAACQVIASGRYLHGEQTALLEQEMAMLCQVKYCIAVSNGLDALRLVIRAYKEMGVLHEGDKVIVPGNTRHLQNRATAHPPGKSSHARPPLRNTLLGRATH